MTTPRLTAHHEAAHAVIHYRAAGHSGGPISIVPDQTKGTLGHADDGVSDSSSRDDMEACILSCYAAGHASRVLDPDTGSDGCAHDDAEAEKQLHAFGWEDREQEFRQRSSELVRRHWAEIVAVAEELLRMKELDADEVELIADAAAGVAEFIYGDLDADLADYRARRP